MNRLEKTLTDQSTNVTTAGIAAGRLFDTNVFVQTKATTGGGITFTLALQGRVSNETACPWFTILTQTEATVYTGGSRVDAITAYPFMREVLTNCSGAPLISRWLDL